MTPTHEALELRLRELGATLDEAEAAYVASMSHGDDLAHEQALIRWEEAAKPEAITQLLDAHRAEIAERDARIESVAWAHEQCEAQIARQGEEIGRLRAAISWIEKPFIDDKTPEHELRSRIKFCVDDAARAALEGQGNGE